MQHGTTKPAIFDSTSDEEPDSSSLSEGEMSDAPVSVSTSAAQPARDQSEIETEAEPDITEPAPDAQVLYGCANVTCSFDGVYTRTSMFLRV